MKIDTVDKKAKRPKRIRKVIIIVALALVVLFVGMLIAIPILVMPLFLGQRYAPTQYDALDYGIAAERIELITDDALTLAAWRTRAQEAKGTVIIISGMQNPSVTAFFGYAKMLADNGWDALLIEMRAVGQSEGEEIGLAMAEWRDVKAGVDFLSNEAQVRDLPIVAMGTSMGGSTVIVAAGALPRIDAVISLSAFSTFGDAFAGNMAGSGVPEAICTMDIPFVNMYIGFHMGFDALKYTAKNGMAQLGERPLLMMHSTDDTQVGYGEFEKLLKQAEKHDVDATTFIRQGDEHFICYEEYFDAPAGDVEFSEAILNFLAVKFP